MSDDKKDGRMTSPEAAEVWATLREVSKELKSVSKELKELALSQKELRLSQKETDRELRLLSKEVTRVSKEVKRVSRQLGRHDSRWGRIIESLVESDLRELLADVFGIKVIDTSSRVKVKGTEIDIVAIDGDTVVLAEVKTTLRKHDINKFIRTKLKRFTELRPRYQDCKIYGVIAYVKIDEDEERVIKHAFEQGLIVIRSMRGTNKVINPKGQRLQDFHH